MRVRAQIADTAKGHAIATGILCFLTLIAKLMCAEASSEVVPR